MERLMNNLDVPSRFDDDVDVFLTLSCGSSSSSSSSEAAAGTPPAHLAPPHVLREHGRGRRRRGQQASSSLFECRKCGREFPTFQALGDHRTSHLRRRATTKKQQPRSSKAAVRVHACAMCGLGCFTGQALGGHMRRHRAGPSTNATGEEEGSDGPAAGYVVDLARAVVLHERPRSASFQLLDLFV